MKKIVSLLLVLTVLFCLGAAASAEEWVFDRGVTIVCPWGEGGGADSTIRPLAELLEEYLGVPVEVRNVTGGSGVSADDLSTLDGKRVGVNKSSVQADMFRYGGADQALRAALRAPL